MQPWESLILLALLCYTAIVAHQTSWAGFATDPCLWATVGATNSFVFLLLLRHVPAKFVWLERLTVALFLGGMPLVYLGRWLWHGGATAGTGWLAVELFGTVVFVGLAILGYRGLPWLLVGGVALHGIAWDSWHLGTSTYVPDWYARACLVIDLGLALYCATRIPLWRQSLRQPQSGTDPDSPQIGNPA